MRFGSTWSVLGLVLVGGALFGPARTAVAQEVNCANEFRSGKLYFSQKLYVKAVDRFSVAVKTCPDKAEYRARYAIALAQLGEDKLKVVEATGDVASNKADVDSVLHMYRLAGSEFEASLKADGSKQNIKFVRENREHFFVARYNEGLKLAEESKNDASVLEFELCRSLDAKDVRVYRQLAVVLVNKGDMAAAHKAIADGLQQAPGDSTLLDLQKRLGTDEAGHLLKDAEASLQSGDTAKAAGQSARADSLLTESLKANPKNPNLLFDRGLARMTRAAANKDSAQAAGMYGQAADDFEDARKLSPAASDSGFYLSALYNEIQASMNAGKTDESIELIKEYLNFDYTDASMWKTYAQALFLDGDQKTGAIGLIVANSMTKGSDVPVQDAEKNAQEDQKKALTDRGKPTRVYSYTETMGDKTVNIDTWIWKDKKKASVYYLGKDNGEVNW